MTAERMVARPICIRRGLCWHRERRVSPGEERKMSNSKVYAIIIVCAAVGGLGGHFASGLAIVAGIAIGAGVGVAIASPMHARRRGRR
jgi:hypothetical protein